MVGDLEEGAVKFVGQVKVPGLSRRQPGAETLDPKADSRDGCGGSTMQKDPKAALEKIEGRLREQSGTPCFLFMPDHWCAWPGDFRIIRTKSYSARTCMVLNRSNARSSSGMLA